MTDEISTMSPHRRWAAFRLAVIGPLLASPPDKGELAGAIRVLSVRVWKHPLSGENARFQFSTIEGWYYAARKADDPIDKLRWKTRSDIGKARVMTDEMVTLLTAQYALYPFWSYRLHADNLAAALTAKHASLPAPSYPTVRRFMRAKGLTRKRRPRDIARDGVLLSLRAQEEQETRSYEKEHVGALWHTDFHRAEELKVLGQDGQWHVPVLVAIFDDHSRLCCHMQWYLVETAETLVHAVCQAILKRGLARELMTDNGTQMSSSEYTTGVFRLGLTPKRTGVRRPNQNGKCEKRWDGVDQRLVAMLDGQKDLTLRRLNDITQAWIEMDYNRGVHRETKERPLDRFVNGKSVLRPSPEPEALRMAFRREVTRRHRKSDGTISLCGRRFELPQRLRHTLEVTVAYATWDLSFVHVIDPRSGAAIARIHPIDKAANASGVRRKIVDPIVITPIRDTTTLPPLLEQCVEKYGRSGLPPAYLPKDDTTPKKEEGNDLDQ